MIGRQAARFMIAAIAIAACTGGDSSSTDGPRDVVEATTPTTVVTTTPSTTERTEAPAPAPEVPPTPLVEQRVVVTGDPEVVFDWTSDRCEAEHIPDIAARAFRDADGNVQLNIGHYVNYRMMGPDFDSLTSDCDRPVLASDFDPDPSQFNDSEWIAAFYTEDGQVVYAVVHNEYRGVTHQASHLGQCPSNDNLTCLDTSFTMAISTDGGDTFEDIAPPPNHLIATLPFVFNDEGAPSGIRQPSNIVRGRDGYFYLFGSALDYPAVRGGFGKQWVCVMRTDDLGDPASWRYWDGTAFAGRFINPYVETAGAGRDAPTCAPVAKPALDTSINEGIVYNEVLDQYVMVGINSQAAEGRPVWGVYYSLSDDLINWTTRELLLEIESGEAVADTANQMVHAYPSIIDHDSPSMSFDTMDGDAYLYISRFNFGGNSLDRDLLRFPIAVQDIVYAGPEWTFDTDGDTEGWIPESGIDTFEATSGTLTMQSSNDDPYAVSGPTVIPASYGTMTITMAVSGGPNTSGQVFFLTDTNPLWDEARSMTFDVIADGEMHEYELDMSSVAGWEGIITLLRFDPVAASGLIIDVDLVSFPG